MGSYFVIGCLSPFFNMFHLLDQFFSWMGIVSACAEEVIILALPPNKTHIIQSLDKGVFQPTEESVEKGSSVIHCKKSWESCHTI